MVDLTGPLSEPMPEDPTPLFVIEITPDFPSDPVRLHVPRWNAARGRSRSQFRCEECGEKFASEKDAIRHAATRRHLCVVVSAYEICPVDRDDDWRLHEDGAGVSWIDRHPDREVAQ